VTILRTCIDCGRPTADARHNRCLDHAEQHRQRRAAKVKASGTSHPHWRKLRLQALERDSHTCRRCGYPAVSVHISPHLGRNHDLATLADCTSMCRHCHGAIDGARAHR
jgi:5-methylcytosine-specific restriction endonuclease McrA